MLIGDDLDTYDLGCRGPLCTAKVLHEHSFETFTVFDAAMTQFILGYVNYLTHLNKADWYPGP